MEHQQGNQFPPSLKDRYQKCVNEGKKNYEEDAGEERGEQGRIKSEKKKAEERRLVMMT
jgi:hypothetical protein